MIFPLVYYEPEELRIIHSVVELSTYAIFSYISFLVEVYTSGGLSLCDEGCKGVDKSVFGLWGVPCI